MSDQVVYWNVRTVQIPFFKTIKEKQTSFVYNALRVEASEFGQQVDHLFAMAGYQVKLMLHTELTWDTLEVFFKKASPFSKSYHRHIRQAPAGGDSVYAMDLMGSEKDSVIQPGFSGVCDFSIRITLAPQNGGEALANDIIFLDPQIIVSEGSGGGGTGGGVGS